MTTKVVFFDFFKTLGEWKYDIGSTAVEVGSKYDAEVDWQAFGPALGGLYNAELPDSDNYDPIDGIKARYSAFAEAIFGEENEAAAWDIASIDHAYLAPQNAKLFEDTLRVLEELKQRGYRLAVISNWDTSLQEVFSQLGILNYFEEVIESHDPSVRSIKPDVEIFEIALDRMGVCAAEAVHIGDTFDADITGASAAGIRAFFLDRKNKKPGIWDETIQSLDEALELL